MKIFRIILYVLLLSPFCGVAQNAISWTGRTAVFTNGTAQLVSYLDLGEITYWGYLEITLTDSYSNTNSTGLYRKTYDLGYNGSFFSNTSEVSNTIGPVCNQWKLGEFIKDSNNHLVVPIFHLSSLGNRISVDVKGITLSVVNSANFVLTAPQVIANSETRDFQHIRGKLAVGTSNADSDAQLTVGGKINARELKVKIDAGADFVFEPNYDLQNLADIEKYVAENKHLPGIAMADEMTKSGLEVGKFQIKLLQKIEELTLYLIEQKKEIQTLNTKVENLQKNQKRY